MSILQRDIGVYSMSAIFLTSFSVVWASISALGMTAVIAVYWLIVVSLLTLGFAIRIFQLRRQAQRVPASQRQAANVNGLWYSVVSGVQFGVIMLAWLLLAMTHNGLLIAPTVILIIGLHFIPLALILHLPSYRWMGLSLSLLAALTIIAIETKMTLGMASLLGWSLVAEVGIVVIFWLTAWRILAAGFMLARQPA